MTDGRRFEWVDAAKAFALTGILLNHVVEEIGSSAWFTNPGAVWPDLGTRLANVWPSDYESPIASLVQFLGWLGDAGPGVFILLSGFGLAWSALGPKGLPSYPEFLRRRVARIYPLYIAAHFVLLGVALAFVLPEIHFGRKQTLLSLMGLRFMGHGFFFVNPSWWFVWTILQLYLVFPILFRIQRRLGPTGFFLLALVLTMAFRGMGWAGVRHVSLYYWMTGSFAGTRLAEFAFGMVLASWFKSRSGESGGPNPWRTLAWSFLIYAAGFAASLTTPGTLVSNLLVSVGLTGVAYGVWEGAVGSLSGARGVVWFGAQSYGVYLLHQAPMRWVNDVTGTTLSFLLSAVVILVLSVVASPYLDRFVTKLLRWPSTQDRLKPLRLVTGVAAALGLLVMAFLEPAFHDGDLSRAVDWVLTLTLALSALGEAKAWGTPFGWDRRFRWLNLLGVTLVLWILPGGWGTVCLVLTLIGLTGARAALRMSPFSAPVRNGAVRFQIGSFAILATGLAVGGLGAGALGELLLRNRVPLETSRWGEYPALTSHPTRGYGLKPSIDLRLRYNNYDYVVKTNSLGLPGPEPLGEADPGALRILIVGDAFTMPEGFGSEEAYPALLEGNLSRCVDGSVEVINAGVTGYGPNEVSPQLGELLPELQPDVVLYQYFINEIREVGRTHDAVRRSIGLTVGNDLDAFLERTQLQAHGQALGRRFFETITRISHPWRYWKALLRFYDRRLEEEVYSGERVDSLSTRIGEMLAVSQESGADFHLLFTPSAAEILDPSEMAYFPWDIQLADTNLFDLSLPKEMIRALAAQTGFPLLDLSPALSVPGEPTYFAESWHWNSLGHRTVADELTRYLVREGYVPDDCLTREEGT